MSSVRMCDRCGTIFSERSEFSTFTGTTRKRDPETGKVRLIQDELDQCPECTELQTGAMRPTIPDQPKAIAPRYEPEHAKPQTFTERETHPEEWAGPGFPPGDFSPGR